MTRPSATVLIAAGSPEMNARVAGDLAAYTCLTAPTAAAARAICGDSLPDALVLADRLPDDDGLTLLGELVGEYGDLAFAKVVLLGADDAALVARAVSLGAHDCLLVERDLPFLPRVVAGALAQLDLRRENACLRHDLAAQRQPGRSEGPQAPGSVEPNGDTTAHKHSERAVSASEAKYHTLFATIDEGFCVLELVFDPHTNAPGLVFREMNPAFERHTGLRNAAGATVGDVLPNFEADWIEVCVRVVATGVAERLEKYMQDIDRWYNASFSRVGEAGERLIAVVCEDITERRRQEAHLTFLNDIGVAFAHPSNVDEIMNYVGKRLVQYLRLSRSDFSLIDAHAGRMMTIYDWRSDTSMTSLLGEHSIGSFLSDAGWRQHLAGQLTVVHDAWHSPLVSAPREVLERLDIGALIDAPHLEQGRWIFLLRACRSQPEEWRADEIELVRDLAARIYVRLERARAEESLRASEARKSFLLQLDDRLLTLADPVAIQVAAVEELGTYLQLSRAGYAEDQGDGRTFRFTRNFTNGVPGIEWLYRYDDYDLELLRELRAGRTVVRPDISGHPTLTHAQKHGMTMLQIGASVQVPLLRAGRLRAVLFTHQREARAWTPAEIGLIEAVASRTWDAVERGRAEQARRVSEARFRSIIENGAEGVVLLNADRQTTYVSPNISALLGYSPDEFMALTMQAITHPEDWPALNQLRNRVFTTPGAYAQNVTRMRHKDGRWRWIERSTVNQLDNPAVHAVIINFRDVTERVEAELAQRRSEERFARAFQASPVAIVISTIDEGRIIDVNRRFLELTMYQHEEVIGKTSSELDMWVDLAARDQLIQQLRREGMISNADTHIRTRRGEVRDVLLSVELIELDGQRQCMLTLIHDITERKRAEQKLLASREQLQELSMRLVNAQEDERRTLAYELHDEIGQQLTALSMALQTDGNAPIEQQGARLSAARRLVATLAGQVRRLSLNLRPPMIDELGLLEALRWHIERYIQQTQVAVDFKHSGLDAMLPPHIAIAAYRIVQEGLTNVARHASTGAAVVQVWIRRGQLTIAIEDQGCGFDVAARTLTGRSVGLASMRERAQLLGGQFQLDSTPGEGTRILAIIPLEVPDERSD